jgi:peptidoglycan/xylan/chitin deacetylase (PgdA/CDA1 family)
VASALFCLLPGPASPGPQVQKLARTVAITIDDLPFNCTCSSIEQWSELTQGILAALEAHQAPAIGFVNELKLFADRDAALAEPARSQPEATRVALLESWLERGFQLGNHSFSHPDLHRTELADFEQDVLRGERITSSLVERPTAEARYFRHPFLHTGRDLETKQQFETFLARHGYTIAPVTIDNSEWIYARAYDLALDRADPELAQRVAASYLDYMIRQTAFFEGQATSLFGREIAQILLLHASRLNADALEALLARLAERGYRFVALSEALQDPAYQREDRYTGPAGMSWIQRWAWTEGKRGDFFSGEPEVEAWVHELSALD